MNEYIDLPALEQLIRYVDEVYLSAGAKDILFGTDTAVINELQRDAAAAGLSLILSLIHI